jgi:hypothetical protein
MPQITRRYPEFQKYMKKEHKLRIDNIEIKQADNTTLVQFDLHIADTILKVVDVIDWDENGKIQKILAYNG